MKFGDPAYMPDDEATEPETEQAEPPTDVADAIKRATDEVGLDLTTFFTEAASEERKRECMVSTSSGPTPAEGS